MKALILAAGYGTRLYPLTKNLPKPLLKLRDLTILDHITSQLEAIEDIERIYIVSNNKFFDHFIEWVVPNIKPDPCHKYKLINDGSNSADERLGAVADIQLAIENQNIDDDLLIIAGDNLFDFDLRQFIDFAREKKPFHSACLYRANADADLRHYGIAGLNGDGEICYFEEKPQLPKTDLISTCIYFFPGEKLHLINRYLKGGTPGDNPGSYIRWLALHDKVYGNICDGMWFDLGDFDSLGNAMVYLHSHELNTQKQLA